MKELSTTGKRPCYYVGRNFTRQIEVKALRKTMSALSIRRRATVRRFLFKMHGRHWKTGDLASQCASSIHSRLQSLQEMILGRIDLYIMFQQKQTPQVPPCFRFSTRKAMNMMPLMSSENSPPQYVSLEALELCSSAVSALLVVS